MDTSERQAGDSRTRRKPPPFEQIALLLQGGGALGAYQAGVYEALAEAELQPHWVAGISIGAINAAIIAGNAPEARVAKLRAFWERVTAPPWWGFGLPASERLAHGDFARELQLRLSAGLAVAAGASGFFAPRPFMPWLVPSGTPESTSFYDTMPLKSTLEQLVDFDRINARAMRLSVGAVNVRTGRLVYFDSDTHKIRPEHVMASGALPPGFPAIEIEGDPYWDGGVVSNTPLQLVADSEPRRDTLAFQVDLWSAYGDVPGTISEVLTRQKDIQYSSRTRYSSDRFGQMQKLRNALASLLEKLPDDLRAGAEAELLAQVADRCVYNLVQLTYRSNRYEGQSKDVEFSRRSMEEHWLSGYDQTVQALRHPEVLQRPNNVEGLAIFDFAEHG
jgi:NTE family protein